MFAQGTFEIGWEGITLVNVTADLADPAAFAVLGFFGLWLWLGFDVLLVIVVGHGRYVRKHLSVKYIGNEHGVCAKINALGDPAGQISVGVFGDI